MEKKYVGLIAGNLGISSWQVENTLKLFDQGSTIPFISRYRKEMTGSLDELQLATIREQNTRFTELDDRRNRIINSVAEQGFMTDELLAKLNAAETLTELEDLYLPFKPKKKTRASVARENGLEPLAVIIMKQSARDISILAEKYLGDQVQNVEDALQGARDIMAEWINEDQQARALVRKLFAKEARI